MRRAVPWILLLAACSSSSTKEDPRLERWRDQQYREAVAKGEIRLGMRKSMVREAWGAPQKRDRIRRGDRKVERWWYPSTFVYFHEDGYVIGWEAPY